MTVSAQKTRSSKNGATNGSGNGSETAKPSAHRPSRRQEIVDAAIRVFAAKSFSEASVQDVADEANVVPSAVYYHFSGKDELFELAMRRVMDMVNDVVDQVRSDEGPDDSPSLEAVTVAVWHWVEAHPDESRLMHYHLPGATAATANLRRDFEGVHVQRAFDYLLPSDVPTTKRAAAVAHASHTLAIRTLIELLMTIHALRMDDGPLSRHASKTLSRAVVDVGERIVVTD
ncbi:TetR/AcrR family transcriptional regulator [Rhodococcoides kyotonense]|uniref:DNA-binding transcriptional regulator, AcrR family n=1 Tax=Rhodococcoides kyotonense TaxID=398843 RepID=A0A239MXG2_9NOCA|nr:TetR/AcrR family transcriptional regulator [Rhodococcus kyotonensis]SNT46862.1 DNA-binding transcriptional regulator, AcrR family [Rhodococcus kyotonensis]